MKRTYKVAYAGMPASSRLVAAGSPREAAMAFFATKPLQNSVIVSTGLLREEVFRWSDFTREVPELRSAELPNETERLPHYDPSRDPIIRLFRAVIVLASFFLLTATWLLSDSDEVPGVALVLLALSGIVTLLVAALASARTLRRYISRDPHSLDAR